MKRPVCVLGLLYLLLWQLLLVCGGRQTAAFDDREGERMCLTGRVGRKVCGENGWTLSVYGVRFAGNGETEAPRQETAGEEGERQNTNKGRGVLCYMAQDAFADQSSVPSIGSYVMVEGVCKPFLRATNEGQFDRQSYEQRFKLDFSLTNSRVVKQSDRYSRLRESLWQLRAAWKHAYESLCSKEEAAFLTAIVLGDTSDMDEELKGLFRQNGLSHLLAVSGMHVSLLGMGIYRLLKRSGAPVFVQVSVSIAVIVGYGIMIGAGTSTLRAILMFSVYLSAKLLGRTYDMATALTIAACVLVTDNPAVLEYAGFVFSFGAILAICLFYPAMKELMGQREVSARSKIGGKIYDAFLLSFSVSLFLLPVQLYFYYELQTYAVLVNLAALPVFSVLLYLAFAGGIAAMLSLRVGGVLLLPCRWLFCCYLKLLTLARKLPHGRYLCGRPQKWQIILFYLVVLGVIVWSRTSFGHLRRVRNAQARGHRIAGRLIPVLLLQTAVCLLCVHIRWHTEITFLDVGQGDCCVIEQKSGSTFLIDAGSSDDIRCAENRLLPFLKANGICEVDYAFLSHPDEDHMNALIACMETAGESGVQIKNLVLSAYAGQDVKYEKIIAAAMAAGCQVVSFVPGDELRIEDVAEPFCIRCLFPYGTERFADTNDQSLLLKVQVGEFRLLFTGDMAQAEERALIDAARKSPALWEDMQRVDILKVAHHGSRYSTCAELLDVISPQAAVISSGQNSRYGHPHAETLQRLEEAQSRVFLTKEMGAVTVTLYESRKSGMRAEIAGYRE